MKKKMLALSLALALSAGAMTGCGGAANTPAPADSAASAPPAVEVEPVGTGEDASADGEAVTLTIWDWDEAHLTNMTAFYTESHPNVNFETLVVPVTDYMQKLQSALASGTDTPDVILGELLYRGRLFDLGILEDLSQAPYNVSKDDMFDFAVQLETGPNGELLGVEQQICPSGFAYRRDLALEYLGTDAPDELAALIPTWDEFITQGQAVAEKSSGAVTIFPGISIMVNEVLRGQQTSAYIDGDNINLTARYSEILDLAARMNQTGILGNQERETPALNAGFAAGEFIFFPTPPWGLKWNIEVNDPEGSGNWGLTKSPGGGFTRGGTSVSIYSGSENKDAAWEYVQSTYCDGPGVEKAYRDFGFMTGFKAPYETEDSYFFTGTGAFDEYFGGQNLSEYYINDITVETVGQIQTKHEPAVINALLAVTAQMANNKEMTADEAMELLKQETLIAIPQAVIS